MPEDPVDYEDTMPDFGEDDGDMGTANQEACSMTAASAAAPASPAPRPPALPKPLPPILQTPP
eukprot:9360705-Prorocentrum_lima.AAC.1